jgi:hypothetical protein
MKMKFRTNQNFQQLTKDHQILIQALSGEEGNLLMSDKRIDMSIYEKIKLKRCLDHFSGGPWIVVSKTKTTIDIIDVPLQKKYTVSWVDSIEEKTWKNIKTTPTKVKNSWVKTSNWVKRNWPSSIF